MIKVLDSIPGSGKTTAMLNLIKSHAGDIKFIYISPFLSEIEQRIPTEAPLLEFKNPCNKGYGKLGDFKHLVEQGENIASTHALFGMFTPVIVDLIIEQRYVLVIDEAIQCVGLVDDGLNQSDVYALMKSEMVFVDREGRFKVSWNEQDFPDHRGKYSAVRNLATMGCLYAFENKFLMFEYPPKLLEQLDNVYILTYMFSGSDMRCWLDLNNIEWEFLDTNALGMVPEVEIKALIKANLEIISNRTLDSIEQTKSTLSSTWFKNSRTEEIAKYKAIIRSIIVSHKVKAQDLFWTTYKKYSSKLESAGFKRGVNTESPCFLPLNTRATNKYKDRNFCVYACNLFKNPVDVRYLKSQGVEVDIDSYALSEMVQFIFRGSIRENKPMKLVILSKRMKFLIENWLEIAKD